ncbi:MAG: hypothetical protein QOF33_78 [Thermomicrobiales bacterium]|nr:hypothetical protein [Thermomicrobiales bacterium]
MKAGISLASLCVVLLVGALSAGAPATPRPVLASQASPAASPAADGESFELAGLIELPGRLTIADLQMLPVETIDATFEIDGTAQTHSYTGVRLWDVLARATPRVDPERNGNQLRKYAVLSANDGYEVVISLGEIDPAFGGQPYLLAWEEDGAALTGDKGPIQLVTPGDETSGRHIWGIVKIEVRDVDSPPRI